MLLPVLSPPPKAEQSLPLHRTVSSREVWKTVIITGARGYGRRPGAWSCCVCFCISRWYQMQVDGLLFCWRLCGRRPFAYYTLLFVSVLFPLLSGPGPVLGGPAPAPHRPRTGLAPAPHRPRTGPAPAPHRPRTGPAPAPPRPRTGPAKDPPTKVQEFSQLGSQ
jgi:hypothetical protein